MMLVGLTHEELEEDLNVSTRLHRKRILLEIAKLVVREKLETKNFDEEMVGGQPDNGQGPSDLKDEHPSLSSTLSADLLQLSSVGIELSGLASLSSSFAASLELTASTVSTESTASIENTASIPASDRAVSDPTLSPNQPTVAYSDICSQPSAINLVRWEELSHVEQFAEGMFSLAYKALYRTRSSEPSSAPCESVVVIKSPKSKPGPNEWSELNAFLQLPPHENIVPFIGICRNFLGKPNTFCIVSEMQTGCLKQMLVNDSHSALHLPIRKLQIITSTASGLAHLHAHHIIHRDIAARNILIGKEGRAVVSDFGLSREIDPQPDKELQEGRNVTESYYRVDSQHLLPIRWMAPESLMHGKFSKKSDVWMFGVTMWEVITSCVQQPYASLEHANEIIIQVCTVQDTLVSSLDQSAVPSFLDPLRDLVRRCLQIDPADRPTMVECCSFLHDLQSVLVAKFQPCPSSPLPSVAVQSQSGKCHAVTKVDVFTPDNLQSSRSSSSMRRSSNSSASLEDHCSTNTLVGQPHDRKPITQLPEYGTLRKPLLSPAAAYPAMGGTAGSTIPFVEPYAKVSPVPFGEPYANLSHVSVSNPAPQGGTLAVPPSNPEEPNAYQSASTAAAAAAAMNKYSGSKQPPKKDGSTLL